MMFKKAFKKKSTLRLLIEGASGSGKTYSALTLATGLGGKIAVIDTEKGSASLYAGEFDFDSADLLPPYTPESYIRAIKTAESAGYNVIIIDSITHEWSGEGGCLDIVNALGGQFSEWKKVTPRHNKFIEAILQCKCHVIATARTKSDYVVELNEKGKNSPKKVGLKTEQRDGLEYEFTTVLRLNQNNCFEATKDRTKLFQGQEGVITENHARNLIAFLNDGDSQEVTEEILMAESDKNMADLEPKINPKVPKLTIKPTVTSQKKTALDWMSYIIQSGPYEGLKFIDVKDVDYFKGLIARPDIDPALKRYLTTIADNLEAELDRELVKFPISVEKSFVDDASHKSTKLPTDPEKLLKTLEAN
jgi:hypothetical protein